MHIYDGVRDDNDKKGIPTVIMFNKDIVLKQLIDKVFVKCPLIEVSSIRKQLIQRYSHSYHV